MAQQSWSLSEVWSRLGIKGGGFPEIVSAVQPVLQVGDVSALTTPLLPPSAWGGGFITGVALRTSVLEVHARASGGAVIRIATWGTAGITGRANWAVLATGRTFVATDATVLSQMGPTPLVSTITLGTIADANIIDRSLNPDVSLNSNTYFQLYDAIFIPQNQFFLLQQGATNQNFSASVLVQDVPLVANEA